MTAGAGFVAAAPGACDASTNSMSRKVGSCGSGATQVNIKALTTASFSILPSNTPMAPIAVVNRWSDPATWSPNPIPAENQTVIIPTGKTVFIDTQTASLGELVIEGELRADPDSDFTITATTIVVRGAVRIGSASRRYSRNGKFVLTGSKSNYTSRTPLQAFKNDGISRSFRILPNAVLELFGAPPGAKRTRLVENAAQNSTTITVESSEGWKVGDSIAISPTTLGSKTDSRRITNLSGNVVTLNQGLSFNRWGRIQYMTDSGISLTPGVFASMRAHPDVADHLDERAVVINLSRNIVIEGRNDSHWAAGHGVHVMWMGLDTTVQLDGVEVRRAGQRGVLGRYAVHAHMQSYNMPDGPDLPSDGTFLGFANKVAVKNCAIHQSMNRGIVIHGTCGAKWQNNVLHDILGHAIFLEDGSELLNEVVGNTVLNVRHPAVNDRILKTDGSSSGIWFSNPNNTLKDNIVGDIAGTGIWNAFALKPTSSEYAGGCFGLSKKVDLHPFFTPTTVYTNNEAFCCNNHGAVTNSFQVDELGNTGAGKIMAMTDSRPGTYGGRQTTHAFDRMKLWMNNPGGYSNAVSKPLYTRWTVADNRGTDLRGSVDDGVFSSGLFVGHSLNFNPGNALYGRHAVATYHSAVSFVNLTFYNYPPLDEPSYRRGWPYGTLEVSGLTESWDFYLSGIELGTMRHGNWKRFNVTHFERTPPINIERMWNNSAGGPDSTVGGDVPARRYWTFSGAVYDHEGLLAGVDGEYLTFDHPFLTYELTHMRKFGWGNLQVATNNKFIGFKPWATDFSVDRYAWSEAVTFQRLTPQYTVHADWVIKDGEQSSFFANMRHCVIHPGGRYRVFNHDHPEPNNLRYSMTTGNGNELNDTFIMSIPWNASIPAVIHTGHVSETTYRGYPGAISLGQAFAYTSVGSRAEMAATTRTFYQDPATNELWFHYQGGHVKPGSTTREIPPRQGALIGITPR